MEFRGTLLWALASPRGVGGVLREELELHEVIRVDPDPTRLVSL